MVATKLSVRDCQKLMNRELGAGKSHAILLANDGLRGTAFLGANIMVNFTLCNCEDGTPYLSMVVQNTGDETGTGQITMLFEPATLDVITN